MVTKTTEMETSVERKPILSTKKIASQMEVGDEIEFNANGYIEVVSKDSVGADGKKRKAFVNAKDVEILLDKQTGEKLVYKAGTPVVSIILLGDDNEKYNISLSNSSSAFKLIKHAEYAFKKQTGMELGHFKLHLIFSLADLGGSNPVLSVRVDKKIGERVYTPQNQEFEFTNSEENVLDKKAGLILQ